MRKYKEPRIMQLLLLGSPAVGLLHQILIHFAYIRAFMRVSELGGLLQPSMHGCGQPAAAWSAVLLRDCSLLCGCWCYEMFSCQSAPHTAATLPIYSNA